MNLAARRQHLRAVKSGEQRRQNRRQGIFEPETVALLGSISIDALKDDPADLAFVHALRSARAERLGLSPAPFPVQAIYLVAKRKMTGERLGCMAVTSLAPPHALVEDFLTAPGRWGKIAGYAMMARLRTLPLTKVGFVRVENEAMLAALQAAGGRITGYVVEG